MFTSWAESCVTACRVALALAGNWVEEVFLGAWSFYAFSAAAAVLVP
jgi:hypothetical protein